MSAGVGETLELVLVAGALVDNTLVDGAALDVPLPGVGERLLLELLLELPPDLFTQYGF